MRVLLIEDEPTTAKSIELMLGSEGFNVYTTDLGEEGLDLGKLYDYDIILLDLNLPDMHGYDVLKKLRTAKVSTPVLILSGIGEMDSKVRALGFGADDYVTKPFHRDELVARIHAIVRRSKGHSQSVIRTGKLAVNLDAKTVEVDGARVHLTGKEYAMLELLSLRKGTTLTKEMFLNHLYGGHGRARNSRSSTCSSASCARSCRSLAAAPTTSRPSGAAAMCCAIPKRARNRSRRSRSRSPNAIWGRQKGEGGALRRSAFLLVSVDQEAAADGEVDDSPTGWSATASSILRQPSRPRRSSGLNCVL
jgi:two-component system cell cycle response regulator CtrA